MLIPIFSKKTISCSVMIILKYNLQSWRLYNGNKLHSLPIAHFSKAILYNSFGYGENKIHRPYLGYLDRSKTGQQSGYTKYCYLICLWESRAKAEQWSKKDCSLMEILVTEELNIKLELPVKLHRTEPVFPRVILVCK